MMAPPRGRYQVKLNAVMFAVMLEELLSGPCTAQDMAAATGMHVLTVQRTIRQLYKRGLVHISGHEKDAQGRWVIRVFKFGAGKDAKRPPPKSRAENRKAGRARDAKAQPSMIAVNSVFALAA